MKGLAFVHFTPRNIGCQQLGQVGPILVGRTVIQYSRAPWTSGNTFRWATLPWDHLSNCFFPLPQQESTSHWSTAPLRRLAAGDIGYWVKKTGCRRLVVVAGSRRDWILDPGAKEWSSTKS